MQSDLPVCWIFKHVVSFLFHDMFLSRYYSLREETLTYRKRFGSYRNRVMDVLIRMVYDINVFSMLQTFSDAFNQNEYINTVETRFDQT